MLDSIQTANGCVISEEQQPLESFFRAKGIKTKNEMADDVSTAFSLNPTNTKYH